MKSFLILLVLMIASQAMGQALRTGKYDAIWPNATGGDVRIMGTVIDGDVITPYAADSNISIQGNGTGLVVVESVNVQGSTISTTTTDGNVTLEGNGAGYAVVETIRVKDNLIVPLNSNDNLVLESNGSGVISVNDAVEFAARTQFTQSSTPSAPTSGKCNIYPKSDNMWYSICNGETVEKQFNNSVAQMALLGRVTWAATASCSGASTSGTAAAFSSDTDCDDNARTIEGPNNATSGAVGNADGQLVQIKLTNVPAGTTRIQIQGLMFSGTSTACAFSINDGTTTSPQFDNSFNGNYVGGISADFTYTVTQATKTFMLYVKRSSGGNSCEFTMGGNQMIVSAYQIPTASQIVTTASPDTDWIDCGLTTSDFSNLGSPVTLTFNRCKREGSDLLMDVKFTTGAAVGGSTASVALKFGGVALTSADSTIIPAISTAGVMTFAANGTAGYYTLKEASSSTLFFGYQGSGNSSLTKCTGSGCFGTSTAHSFIARVPIAGWQGSNRMIGVVAPMQTAIIKHVLSSGTAGGTCTAGSYVQRSLNTLEGDSSIVSLTSDTITVAATGEYMIKVWAPAFQVDSHKAKLRNSTAGTDIAIGQTAYSGSPDGVMSVSYVTARATLAAGTNVQVHHRCITTKSTSGFGAASAFGDSEVYTIVEFTKL